MEGPSQPWSNPLDAREVPDSSAPAFVQWVTRNKLKALVYIWGGGITTCLAYQWTRPIPTSLKIIHTRMYAQIFTLAALGGVAAVEFYTSVQDRKEQEAQQ